MSIFCSTSFSIDRDWSMIETQEAYRKKIHIHLKNRNRIHVIYENLDIFRQKPAIEKSLFRPYLWFFEKKGLPLWLVLPFLHNLRHLTPFIWKFSYDNLFYFVMVFVRWFVTETSKLSLSNTNFERITISTLGGKFEFAIPAPLQCAG